MALLPRIPNAPNDYDAMYFAQVWRTLLSYFNTSSTNLANGSSNDYSTLPTSGYNLRVGQIYVSADIVKVVLSGVFYMPSFALTLSLGTITVS
jgi:predicted secreted protein